MEIKLPEPVLPKGEQQIRVVTTEIRRVGEEKDRTLEFVASDETTDRYRDIVMTDGWEIAAYKKNPVFLWGHSHGSLPVGRSMKTFVGDHPSKKGKDALIHHVQFAQKGSHYDDWPITTPTPETIYRMYTSEPRMLNAVSVGFMPLAYEPIVEKEGDKEIWTGGFRFLKQELLELSAVTVPANPSALIVNGFDPTGLRQADIAWLTAQCERMLGSFPTDTDKAVMEQWKEAVAKVREIKVESRVVSVPAEPAPVTSRITITLVPDPAPEEVAKEVAAETAEVEKKAEEPAPVATGKKQLSQSHKERLQEIISMCQEMLGEEDEDEGEEDGKAADVTKTAAPASAPAPTPAPTVPAKVEEPDPDAVRQLGQHADELLAKLGVAGAPEKAVASGAPTASVMELNPYALLLGETQSAAGMLKALSKKQ